MRQVDPHRRKFDNIASFLDAGVGEGVFPGAVLLIAKDGQILFHECRGHLSLIPRRIRMKRKTIFDLASLTKPLCTTLAIMKLVDEGKIHLDRSLSHLIPTNLTADKRDLTPRLLLSHCSGFAHWKPYYLELVERRPEERKKALREWILKEALTYDPGKGSIYSDLGFMILEWIIEETSGVSMHPFLQRHFYQPLSLKSTFLCPDAPGQPFKKEIFAATEACPWRKKVIQGEVHDENAWALGGYSGHAGLFGTAEEVYMLVNLLRQHYLEERNDYLKPETVRAFFTRQDIVKESTWRLGWDTPSQENSSAGKYFSRNSVGHTGFTGTSVWMDLDQDIVVILLTNRVHPTRNNEKIRAFRPRLHDLIMEELDLD